MKKNGFTLIELLAVIIVIAILALITTPIVIRVIDKVRKGALEDSAYGIIDAGKIYYTSLVADENQFVGKSFDLNKKEDIRELNVRSSDSILGKVIIDDNGNVAMTLYDKEKKWCIKKKADSEKVEAIDYDETCEVVSAGPFAVTVNGKTQIVMKANSFNVQAPPAEKGKKFYGWFDIDKEKYRCYSSNCTLYTPRDMNLIPVYIDENEEKEKEISLFIDSYYYSEIQNKNFFTSFRNLPSGYTVVEHGILITKLEELYTGESDWWGVKGVLMAKGTGKGLLGNYTAKHSGLEYKYARAYLKYKKDGSDEVLTLYSDKVVLP